MEERIEKVTKSNELITASYSLSTREQRLLLAAISLCNPLEEIPSEIKITADYYSSIFQTKNPYRDMRLAAKNLFERSVVVTNEHEDGEMRWLAEKWKSRREDEGGGYVRLVFTESLKKYLSELSGYFSSYEVRRVGKFKSAYTFRIFEMLMMYKRNGWLAVGVDTLRARLDLPDSYASVTNMRKHVLDVAIAEINGSSGLRAEYEVIYEARRAVAFRFRFSGDGVGKKKKTASKDSDPAGVAVEAQSNAEDQPKRGGVRDAPAVSSYSKESYTKASPVVYEANIDVIRSSLGRKRADRE